MCDYIGHRCVASFFEKGGGGSSVKIFIKATTTKKKERKWNIFKNPKSLKSVTRFQKVGSLAVYRWSNIYRYAGKRWTQSTQLTPDW